MCVHENFTSEVSYKLSGTTHLSLKRRLRSERNLSGIYNLLWNIVKEGGHRGLAECQKLFKAEIWNCSLHDQHVFQKLPIFFKRSLPHGK